MGIKVTYLFQAFAGQRKVDPTADHVFCLSESDRSMTIPMMCPAPPRSPHLRIEGMHAEGIDITWEMPQQYGDAVVSVSYAFRDTSNVINLYKDHKEIN